jgi:hypothetical protein
MIRQAKECAACTTQRGRANRKSFEVEVANADFYF